VEQAAPIKQLRERIQELEARLAREAALLGPTVPETTAALAAPTERAPAGRPSGSYPLLGRGP